MKLPGLEVDMPVFAVKLGDLSGVQFEQLAVRTAVSNVVSEVLNHVHPREPC